MNRLANIAIPQIEPITLAQSLAREWAGKLTSRVPLDVLSPIEPSEWMSNHYYIDRPRNPVDAAMLPKGPIRLAGYQKRILDEAFRRDGDGKLIYTTIVWSEPKKSGKTALAAGAGMYMGEMNEASRIYCLANDGKQSKDRIFNAMARCMILHGQLGGIFAGIKPRYSPPYLRLNNGTIIEAIPCDAAGEAGAEPLMTIWSEMWGFAQKHKERMWSEMTIPPTLFGYAMRWVESYAGYEGESTVLWKLYDNGVNQGYRHPQFPDLPVYVNERAKQLTLWSEESMQPWQTKEFYEQEAEQLTPNEYKRIHKNQWVVSTTSLFDDTLTWDKCKDIKIAHTLPHGDDTPMVLAIDAGYATDCAAIIGATRHPDDEWDADVRRVVERYVAVFKPEKGKPLDFTLTLEPAITKACDTWNVWKVVYDPYQLHKLCTDLRQSLGVPFEEFSQAGRRLKADKQFYDMVVHRQYIHSGHPIVRQHIINTSKDEKGRHMRFVKGAANKPIDLTVAASMAVDEILRLNA